MMFHFQIMDHALVQKNLTSQNIGDKLHIFLLHDESFDKIWQKIVESEKNSEIKQILKDQTNVCLGHLIFAQILKTKSILITEGSNSEEECLAADILPAVEKKIWDMFCEKCDDMFELEQTILKTEI